MPVPVPSMAARPHLVDQSTGIIAMNASPDTTPARLLRTVRGTATSDGAGVRLTRVIGGQELPDLDPFLLLDEFGTDRPEDYLAGFPDHPHRGF